MRHSRCLTIAIVLMAAGPALAADNKPGVSSGLPAVQSPAAGTASRMPAPSAAPGPAVTSAVAVPTPLKCSVAVGTIKGSKWGGGGTYRSYRVTNSLGGRQPLAAGSRIKWSASGPAIGYGGEHVLAAPLPPGQTVEVGASDNPKPAFNPTGSMQGVQTSQPACEAKLLP